MTDQQDPTPGPLTAHRYMGTEDNWYIRAADGSTVASRGTRLKRADALRFAASAEMEAALVVAELAAAELCQGQDPANECWVTLATIRAALNKAKGIT